MISDLTKEVLHFLDGLDFNPKIKSSKLLSGRHTSAKTGQSPDFMEHRHYETGDVIGDIDWRASARSEQILIKKKEHQGLIPSWIVLDGSGSMNFPEKNTKYRTQVLLAGMITHLLIGQGDPVGMLMNTEGNDLKSLSPRRGRDGLSKVVELSATHQPSGNPSIKVALEQLGVMVRTPSVIWLITDFDEEAGPILDALHRLRELGCEVRVLHLYHPWERDLPWRGDSQFIDLENTEGDRLAKMESIAKEYAKEYQRHVDKIQKLTEDEGLAYAHIDVTKKLEDILSEVFSES